MTSKKATESSQIRGPCMSREFIQRHDDELRTMLYNPDEQAFPDPIEIRRRDERNKKVVDNVSDKAINGAWTRPKRRMLDSLSGGLR